MNRVGIDDYQGGYLAAGHLIEAGHRTLGFVGPLHHDVGGGEQTGRPARSP